MNYLFYGKDEGRIQKEITRIIENYQDDCDVVSYDMMTCRMGEIVNELTTLPFFCSHKVVIVRNCIFLSNGGSDVETELLEHFLKQPLKENTLIMCANIEKCDARKKFVKLIQQTCQIKAFQMLDERDKKGYISEQCKNLKIVLDMQSLHQLASRLPTDTKMIDLQLEKLSCYPDKIDEEVIEALILRPLEENIFQLSESLLNGKFKKAYRLYKDLKALNYDPIYLLAVIASQMRFYYQVKVCQMQGMSEEKTASFLKAHPYRVKLTMQMIWNVQAETIMKVLDMALQCDMDIKSGKREKYLAFEMFLIQCQEDNR